MERGELIALAVIVVAVVIRGWPRRRNDRWHLKIDLERDRSDDDKGKGKGSTTPRS